MPAAADGSRPATTSITREVNAIDILAASEAIAKAQPRVASLLEDVARSEHPPQSILLAGPEGSGKELMAVRLAAMLNCENGAGEVCGDDRCPACAKVRNLEYPDLHLVYPVPAAAWERDLPVVIESRRGDFFASGEFHGRARSIGIDLVRLVIEALAKHPFEGRRSVVVLFEAHLATTEAQNALLRILEEPPPSATIMLVTEFPDRLLPTILSRCYEIRFEGLSDEAVADFLVRFYSVEPSEARRLAVLAQGNLRRGIHLIDERFVTLGKDAATLVRLVLGGTAKELIGEAEGLAGTYGREDVGDLLEEASIIFSLLIRSREGRLTQAQDDFLRQALGADRIAAAAQRDLPGDMRKISRSIANLRRNADVELTLSQLLLDLAGEWC
jgi:DNA polymerase III delta prime subunit